MGEAASAAFQGSFCAQGNKRRVAPAQKRGSFHMYLQQRGTERFHPGLQPRNRPPLALRWSVITVRSRGEVSPDVGGDLGEIRTLSAWIRQASFTTRLVLKPRWELFFFFFFCKVSLVCRDNKCSAERLEQTGCWRAPARPRTHFSHACARLKAG